jgi:hypothetical protein
MKMAAKDVKNLEEGFVFISGDQILEAMREMSLDPLEGGAVNGTACINSGCTNNSCSNGLFCKNQACTKNRRRCDGVVEPIEG